MPAKPKTPKSEEGVPLESRLDWKNDLDRCMNYFVFDPRIFDTHVLETSGYPMK